MARSGYKCQRWTADTETACLLALRLHGSLRKAAAAIGRGPAAICYHKRHHPDFARRWQAALDECRAEAVAARQADAARHDDSAMPNRVRYDGWTPLRQRAFLRELTESGRLEESCRAVGLSMASLQRMRRRYPSFDAACERALARSQATLEQIAYERAVDGWDEPILWQGKVVGYRRRFSHTLLAMLLRQEQAVTLPEKARDQANLVKVAREAARRAGGYFDTPASAKETDAALLRNLTVLGERLKREAAEAAAVAAEPQSDAS